MKSLFAGGIKTDKACLLIALDQMFPNGYEGRDFIIDMFAEHFQETGFPSEHFHILEECAPVQVLPEGRWNLTYDQKDMYVSMTCHNFPLQYKIHVNKPVIYVYRVKGDSAHAVCIPASLLLHFIETTEYCHMILPRGVIQNRIQYQA